MKYASKNVREEDGNYYKNRIPHEIGERLAREYGSDT